MDRVAPKLTRRVRTERATASTKPAALQTDATHSGSVRIAASPDGPGYALPQHGMVAVNLGGMRVRPHLGRSGRTLCG